VNGEDYPARWREALEIDQAGINAGAVQAVCGGKDRYRAVLFLPQAGIRKAANALGIS
jgi:hypothetical protein